MAQVLADAVVTTGGTSEPIDGVRSVTNFATGRFGLELAAALRQHCPGRIHVLASSLAAAHAAAHPGLTDDTIEVHQFRSHRDLQSGLAVASTSVTAPVVLHLAAVADYAPIPAVGKLSSDQDELVIRMRRTSKLVDDLRDTFGREAFLVGAKLLVNVEVPTLLSAARHLLHRAGLNLVIANDLAECHGGQHPCWLVTPEGGALRLVGTRTEVAAQIASFIALRAQVTWTATCFAPVEPVGSDVPARRLLGQVLTFAQQARLLTGSDGNAAALSGLATDPTKVRLIVTPRQVDKSVTTAANALTCVVDLDQARTATAGPTKPSIDTSVQARLIHNAGVPADSWLLHFHGHWGRVGPTTSHPLPCGAVEEADLIINALSGSAWSAEAFGVELVHHGALIVGGPELLDRLRQQWQLAIADWEAHLADVGASGSELDLHPVFDCDSNGPRIVGVVAVDPAQGSGSVFLGAAARGRGLGKVVARQMSVRRLPLATIAACEVRGYWAAQGFVDAGPDSTGTFLMAPPASVDVTDPVFTGRPTQE